MTALAPAEINTVAQLAAALDRLRGSRSLRNLETAATTSGHAGRMPSALPRSTVSDVLKGKSVPTVETLVALLRVCGVIDEPSQRAWLEARDRVVNQRQRHPPGAVRVRDARPRLLGVHAPIHLDHTTPEPSSSELPLYVPRDLDADLRDRLTVGEQRGGFVLLLGDSSVGKTRTLFEAVLAVLPAWWLLHPADTETIRDYAAAPTPQTVVWLDELQNYLGHPAGLSSATVRSMITAGVVVVATLWPGEYTNRIAPRSPDRPHPEDRQLLGLADVVTVPGTFSTGERRRAEDLAATDQRIRVALETPDAGFTQVMAAGPELVRWWENAPDEHCYGKAVITAALDARRVGARRPATRDYLAAAVPGYLTSRQRADAPPDWLDQALDYATTPLHGATAALCPVAADMGEPTGYQVADYLHQRALRVRRTTRLPDTAWRALVQHHDPDDTVGIADSAARRDRPDEAETLYREHLAAEDDPYFDHYFVAGRLQALLAGQGRSDDTLTRHLTLDDDPFSDIDPDDAVSAYALVRHAWDEFTSLTDSEDPYDARTLAKLLARQRKIDDALNQKRALTDNDDDPFGVRRKVTLWAQQRQVAKDLTEYWARANKESPHDARRTGDLLVQQGRIDDALTQYRALADNQDPYGAQRLAIMLAKQDRINELTHRASNGDRHATHRLIDLLIKQGQIDDALTKYRELADNGDEYAAHRLVDLLVDQHRVGDLAAEVAAGTPGAVEALRSTSPRGQTTTLPKDPSPRLSSYPPSPTS